jgi:holo-[acyl-carrier protein] synthase
MAVIGIGVDALEIERLRSAVTRTPALLPRLFTERERAASTSRCGDLRVGGLAGRFTVKEAVAKALGTGVCGFGFRDIEVLNDERGKPIVVLHGGAARLAESLGATNVQVSITHSRELAVAQAVVEG